MAEVEDFVDFLKSRDQSSRLVRVAARVAEPSLKKVWDNSEDSIYDTL
ncbi:MAG: toxin-antitoxin system, antitoxin component, Xre family protein [Gammaproteobacteria bacterium]|nr:toxin-antitoxin system, antitoxin component, Xre family protein [Gammaproteobacteria bacterium]MBU2477512.1 toxin-antitoxin system, antitoxin component, Xre family protein [Gammaproteobacteria bacterium]